MNGLDGLQGDKGRVGVKGLPGFAGLAGEEGEKGSRGQKASRGDQGNQGAFGGNGDNGQKGMKGESGECKGEPFCVGPEGMKGNKGQPGSDGNKGSNGAQGERGQGGERGDRGTDGAKGDPGTDGRKGNTGGAIEIDTVTVDETCSDGGELKYDNIRDRLHYCNGTHYICIGNNGLPCEKICECLTDVGTLMCGTTMTQSTNTNRNVSIDFVLVMDDSSSMKDQQAWILQHIPTLHSNLFSNNIGIAEGYPNTFQLIAFGGNPDDNGVDFEAPHFVTPTRIHYDPVTEAK
ncbi:collagen-like protein, partial [Salmonella sp. s54836]|uniref:collagen-like triple helix repeat-containing protein n=1 Tax=Salmonella sp. s54836 TaxID=3159673 RepID=UPI00397F9A97